LIKRHAFLVGMGSPPAYFNTSPLGFIAEGLCGIELPPPLPVQSFGFRGKRFTIERADGVLAVCSGQNPFRFPVASFYRQLEKFGTFEKITVIANPSGEHTGRPPIL